MKGDSAYPTSPWHIKSVFRVDSDDGNVPITCHSVQGREWALIVGYRDGSLHCYRQQAACERIGMVNYQVISTVTINSTLTVADVTGRVSSFRNGILYDRIQGLNNLSHMCIERLLADNYNIAAVCCDVLVLFGGTQNTVQIKMPGRINSLVSFNYAPPLHNDSRHARCLAISIVGSSDIITLANGVQLGVLKAPIRAISMCSGRFIKYIDKRECDDEGDLAIVSEEGELYVYSEGEFHHWTSIGYSAQAVYQCKAPEGFNIPDAIVCIGHFDGWKIIHQSKIVFEFLGNNNWLHSGSIYNGKSSSILSFISYCNVIQSYEIQWPENIKTKNA